jgi:hypothetical protein
MYCFFVTIPTRGTTVIANATAVDTGVDTTTMPYGSPCQSNAHNPLLCYIYHKHKLAPSVWLLALLCVDECNHYLAWSHAIETSADHAAVLPHYY